MSGQQMTVSEALEAYVELSKRQQRQTSNLFTGVMNVLDDVSEEFCEHYCKFAASAKDSQELFKQCEMCPLGKL